MKGRREERRSFIKGLIAGSLAVAGFARSGEARAETLDEAGTGAASDEVLYRETDDFRRYYDSLRS